MTPPSARVWLATFVGLVFTIGLLAGIVLERTVLHERGSRRPGVQGVAGPGSRGPGGSGPGGPGTGRGADGPRRGGPGRGGPMFGPPPAQYVEDLGRELQLTDTQRTEILTMLEAQETRLQQMQEEARKVFIQEQAGLHERIAAVLTPAQAAAFTTWVNRRTGMRGGGPPR